MSTRNLIILLVPLVLLAGLLLNMRPLAMMSESEAVSSQIVYDQDVAETVEAFGLAMRSVSVLSPNAADDMDDAYGPFVSADLLASWKASPEDAPGRETSSPYPARIQIGQMEGGTSGFLVHGTVVEVVNGEDGEEIVGTYPVELLVQNQSGSWRITAYEEGLYSRIPSRATIFGTFTCLPHRDTSGPQTMECAFGIQEDGTGDHYAVNTQLMSSTDWQQIPNGQRVEVEGVMVPIENLSTNMWQKYDIVGIISATMIRQI